MAERLYRSRDDRMLAGVAAGVAETLDADPSIVRIVWALLAILTGGIAIVVYIVMAIVVPEAPATWSRQPAGGATAETQGAPDRAATPGGAGSAQATAPGTAQFAEAAQGSDWATDREARRGARHARLGGSVDSSRAGLLGGLVLIVTGAIFLIREVLPWFDWNLWWPIGLIVLGALFLVLALLPRRPAD